MRPSTLVLGKSKKYFFQTIIYCLLVFIFYFNEKQGQNLKIGNNTTFT